MYIRLSSCIQTKIIENLIAKAFQQVFYQLGMLSGWQQLQYKERVNVSYIYKISVYFLFLRSPKRTRSPKSMFCSTNSLTANFFLAVKLLITFSPFSYSLISTSKLLSFSCKAAWVCRRSCDEFCCEASNSVCAVAKANREICLQQQNYIFKYSLIEQLWNRFTDINEETAYRLNIQDLQIRALRRLPSQFPWL